MNRKLTPEQYIDLRLEFVEFKLNEMTHEDMYSYIRDIMMLDVDPDPEILKDTIDEYDDNLYDVLVPYVLDEEGSWEIMQEFKSDRAMLDFLHSGDDF